MAAVRNALLLCLVIWTGSGSVAPAFATAIEGADDPGFRQAVEAWLADDDAHSLPRLSQMAQRGNRAARLLLARIEATDRAPGAFLRALGRAERNELFRGGATRDRFRPSWLRVEAAGGHPFAAVLYRASQLGIDTDLVRDLHAFGEVEADEHQVRKIAVDGSPAQRAALADYLGPGHELAPYLHAFRFARAGASTGRAALQAMIADLDGGSREAVVLGTDADTARAAAFVDIGFQAGRHALDYTDDGHHAATITRWLLQAPGAAPVARLCRRHCTEDDLANCLLTAFGLVGGYYELLRFDSPLETLISQERFLASERAMGMVARRVANARDEAANVIFGSRELRDRSRCLAAAIERPD